jgi:hypothetical protein
MQFDNYRGKVKFEISDAHEKLSAWHSKQAAMLYHYASLDYLLMLRRMLTQLIDGQIDPLLDLAQAQNRDSMLVDARWGTRNTSANWSNNAWPFLKDFQISLAKDIAGRALERYKITGANQCMRGMNEYSMQWATPEEEQRFTDVLEAIGRYAAKIDDTLSDSHDSRWSDSAFAYYYKEFAAQFPRIPKFRVRTDVQAETGKTPPRTGVYVAQDDPHAALQFGWVGGGGGKLRPSETFNDIGLDALNAVGRKDLWFDDQKMFDFATSRKYAALFKDHLYYDGQPAPDLAPSAVSREAFTDRPCKGYFVELINGEFEDIAQDDNAVPAAPARLRVEGGQPCPEAGFYFTPARTGSRRRFAQGETMPDFDAHYGKTIWQWDTEQDES